MGEFFFRYRGVLPLAIVLVSIVFFILYPSGYRSFGNEWVRSIICLSLFILGAGIRAYTVATTPKNTSGRNTETQIAETLNTTGLYSLVRNPLYLGNFLMWVSLLFYTGNFYLLILGVLFFAMLYHIIITHEESFLKGKFGHHYIQWMQVTPRFLPRIGSMQTQSLPFSYISIFRREYSGWIAWSICLLLLELAFRNYLHHSLNKWMVLCALIILAIALVCRTLKKNTQLLNEQGRS